VEQLLRAGAQIEAANEQGFTALITASSGGHVEVVRLLLAAGADVNAAANNGHTSLIAAASHGHEGVVRLLLNAGADTAATINKDGRDAAAAASEAGADMVAALMAASQEGRGDVVRLLLAAGADVNAANKDEMDAAALASEKGHPAIARLLQQAAGAESSEATRAPSDSPSPSSPSSPSSDPGPDEASALTWSRAKMNIEETVCGSIRARSAVYPEMKAFISEVAAKFAAAPGGAPAFLSGQCLENFLALPDARTPQDGLKPIIVGPLVRAMRERKALDEAEAAAAASGEAPSPDPSSRADGTPLVHGDLHKGLRKVYDGNEEGWIPMRIPRHTCATCGKLGNFKKCARCQGPRYCSKECQVDNWKDHKQECEPRSAPPA